MHERRNLGITRWVLVWVVVLVASCATRADAAEPLGDRWGEASEGQLNGGLVTNTAEGTTDPGGGFGCVVATQNRASLVGWGLLLVLGVILSRRRN
jgi:hypothetical protein